MRMKKKKYGNERLNLLGELLVTDIDGFVASKDEIYENKNPLRIEIGCGKGDFIRGKSVQEPVFNYLAIEKILDVCVLAVENYAKSRNLGDLATNGGWQTADGTVYPLGSDSISFGKEQLGNVRFTIGDAKELLTHLPDNSVDSIFINFCDPWGKKGHTKRRLTYIEFLKMYSRILTPNGKIYFKTDNRPLFDFSLEEVEKSPFTLEYHTFDLHNSDMNSVNIKTEYERNFSAKGFSINMLIAKNNK
ncbi:MAG: tRNA (guanosine(46)-N7)-methyltransferase TrmB [Clostridia bacterium]|nr:tRNA (guanosine(46)-N7)-methyltransferase TrmB [Clostridia bacterium]